MAITKSAKIQAEIEKVKAKIAEQQTRLKELEQKKLEAENSEIVDIVRGMSVSLEELPLDAYRAHSELFEDDLYQEINLTACAEKRASLGGTSVQSVESQITWVRAQLNT